MSSFSPTKRPSMLPQSRSRSVLSPIKPLERKTQSKPALIDDVLQASYSEDESVVARSKSRIDSLTSSNLSESEAILSLRRQLHTRDWYIDLLKEKLIEARVGSRLQEGESVCARDRTIQQLIREKGELLKSVQTLEAENQSLLKHVYDAEGSQEDSGGTVLALQAEVVELRAKLESKDSVTTAMKRDLTQLSEIIQGMTALNTELNDKLAKLTLDMEEKEKTCYQALAKAQHIEETEKTLAEVLAERQRLESRVQKLTESNQKITDMEKAAEELKSAFASLESRLPAEFAMQIDHIRGVLSLLHAKTARKVPDAEALKNKAKQLEMELRSVNRELARAGMNESALKTRLAALESEREKLRKELQVTFDSLKDTVSVLQKGLNGMAGRYDALAAENERVNADLQKLGLKVNVLQGKLDAALAAAAQSMKAEGKAVLALKDVQLQLATARITKNTADAALQVREQRVREETAKLKIMAEELWRRDTLILKKTAEVQGLEERVKTLQALREQMKAKITASASTHRGYKSLDSRGRLIPAVQHSISGLRRARTHQSKSLVFSRIEAGEKHREALETAAAEFLGAGEEKREQATALLERELVELLRGGVDRLPQSWLPDTLKSALSLPAVDPLPVSEILSALQVRH